tara:strand:- start:137 stop:382 length:246 start_codon:yes stop_codon:yes gene_type:complete
MDKQIQQEYESLLETFNQDGWKLYSEELVDMFNHLKDTAHEQCKTNDEWQFRRGQLEVLGRLITYEEFQKAGYEQQDSILQ